MKTRSAAILARGLGARMRKADGTARLSADQAAAADAGMKGMIPIRRPFMDYVLTAVSEAGFERVCIVIGPEHSAVRDYYTRTSPPSILTIDFEVQEKPLGTADAVLAVESFADGEPFIVLNSDNYYPPEVLARLSNASPPALIGFARSALVQTGNVPADRVTRFGALEIDDDGNLISIMPRGDGPMRYDGEIYASMNCWLFDSQIFDLCRKVPVSPRGELELPRAVQLGVDSGMKLAVIRVAAPVLDLSTRGDIERVKAKLSGARVSY